MRKENDQIRREEDKLYACSLCGRNNLAKDTVMKDNRPECMWICEPYINSVRGNLLKIIDKREE